MLALQHFLFGNTELPAMVDDAIGKNPTQGHIRSQLRATLSVCLCENRTMNEEAIGRLAGDIFRRLETQKECLESLSIRAAGGDIEEPRLVIAFSGANGRSVLAKPLSHYLYSDDGLP